jgi:hypothetical protein
VIFGLGLIFILVEIIGLLLASFGAVVLGCLRCTGFKMM